MRTFDIVYHCVCIFKCHRRQYTEENKLCLKIGSSVITESV